MMLTESGLRETTSSLAEAKGMIRRRRSELQARLGVIEAELSQLGKIEAAYDFSLELLRAEMSRREADKKAAEA